MIYSRGGGGRGLSNLSYLTKYLSGRIRGRRIRRRIPSAGRGSNAFYYFVLLLSNTSVICKDQTSSSSFHAGTCCKQRGGVDESRGPRLSYIGKHAGKGKE
jgi:hypothetical protein